MRKSLALAAVVIVGLAAWLLWPASRRGLVLYSAVDYGPLVARAFSRKTGIPVHVVTSSTGQLLARISAEGDHARWSLAWFDGAVAAAGLDRAGRLARHIVPRGLLTREGAALVPRDGAWVPTAYTLAGVFVSRRGEPRPPSDWRALTGAAMHGRLGMNDPAISGPTYPLLAGMLEQAGGWPAGKSYLEALRRNGIKVYPKNKATLAALKAGRISVALVQSSAAYALVRASHGRYAVTLPRPAFRLPRVIVEAAGLSPQQRREAQEFVRFALSPQIVARSMRKGEADGLFWPVSMGAGAAPPVLPDPASVDTATLAPAYWGALEGEINAWFARTVAGQ